MYLHGDEENLKERGVIVFLKQDKGYGFIEIEGYKKNVFFHARDVRGLDFVELRINDKVDIEGIRQTEKGFDAGAVYLVKDEA